MFSAALDSLYLLRGKFISARRGIAMPIKYGFGREEIGVTLGSELKRAPANIEKYANKVNELFQ